MINHICAELHHHTMGVFVTHQPECVYHTTHANTRHTAHLHTRSKYGSMVEYTPAMRRAYAARSHHQVMSQYNCGRSLTAACSLQFSTKVLLTEFGDRATLGEWKTTT